MIGDECYPLGIHDHKLYILNVFKCSSVSCNVTSLKLFIQRTKDSAGTLNTTAVCNFCWFPMNMMQLETMLTVMEYSQERPNLRNVFIHCK